VGAYAHICTPTSYCYYRAICDINDTYIQYAASFFFSGSTFGNWRDHVTGESWDGFPYAVAAANDNDPGAAEMLVCPNSIDDSAETTRQPWSKPAEIEGGGGGGSASASSEAGGPDPNPSSIFPTAK
jgi:hypothetical protein